MRKTFLIIAMACLGTLLIVSHMLYATDNDRGQSSAKPLLSGEVKDGLRIIKVDATRYRFSPDPIVVKPGEKVRLIITSSDVTHGLAISEFKVNVSIPAGKTETVEFTTDKDGTFRVYCSVYCGPGHGKMRGTLIVVKN